MFLKDHGKMLGNIHLITDLTKSTPFYLKIYLIKFAFEHCSKENSFGITVLNTKRENSRPLKIYL